MKMKYYLRGLGVGLILGSLMFMIAGFFHKPTLSKSELVAQAQKYGLEVTEKSDGTIKSDSEEKKKKESKKNSKTKKEVKTGKEVKEPEESTKNAEKPETPEQPAAPEQEEVNIVVQNGMSSDTVSQVLADHGVISDWKDFNRYLESNNYGKRIQPGNFTVPKNASYEDLARILSKSR
jgi:outer membrane biosynthesis protein TonB